MVNPGAFSGSRKAFLLSQKDFYAMAVEEGDASEAISTIQRRFFLRYPVELAHDVEPSEEDLAAVDDSAAVPDPEGPNPDLMSLEEYTVALSKWEERQKLVLFRKAQIKRWFAYQYMKDMDLDATKSGTFNPYRALVSQLTGKKFNSPRQKSAANTWRKTQRDAVEAEIQLCLAQQGGKEAIGKGNMIAFRDRVARDMFYELSEEEQHTWRIAAIQEHQAALKTWKAEMEGKPATDPKSRQVAIQGLVKFMQLTMDMVCDATGWTASFICGGPEPARGGLLNVVSLHSGTTSGDVKMSFGRAERASFRKVVVPLYGNFLQKCFTPVECRSRALSAEEGFLSLADLDLENEGASVDLIDPVHHQPPPIRLGSVVSSRAPSTSRTMTPVERVTPAPPPTTRPAPPPMTRADLAKPAPKKGYPSASGRIPKGSHHLSKSSVPTRAQSASGSASQGPQQAAVARKTPPPTVPTPAIRSSNAPGSVAAEENGDAASNPFPIDFQEGDESIPTNEPTSCNATPLPSPCPSPTASERVPVPSRNSTPIPSPCPSPLRPPVSVPNNSAVGEGASTADRGEVVTRAADQAAQIVEAALSQGPSTRRSERTSKKGTNKRTVDESHPGVASADGPVAKRPRKSKGDHVEEFVVPEEAPDWFKKAYKMLSSTEFGGGWAGVLTCWASFESVAGYAGAIKVGTADRPQAIKDWIQRARSPTWRPNISNPASFGSEVRQWWVGMQPEWRVEEGGYLSRSLEGDYSDLRRPGINGLLSVLAGLFFWGDSLKEGAHKNKDWLEVADDLLFVLTRLSTLD